jgi:hypothetical protein
MKKNIFCIAIIAGFIILQACSKKDSGPIATGYEGIWTGKAFQNTIPAVTNNGMQFNLKLAGTVTGKIKISPDGATFDSVRGNWSIIDTFLSITFLTPNNNPGLFIAKLNKDTLKGYYQDDNLYLSRKK